MGTVFLFNFLALTPHGEPEGGAFPLPTHFSLTMANND